MRRYTALMAFALCLAWAAGAAGAAEAREENEAVVRGPVAAQIDEALQRETKGAFWGAVLVAREGEILLAKGYGFADYAQKPNGPDTLFEIASLSKQVTAAAILKLEQQGKLKTSATLDVFFDGLPEDKHEMQVLHLLHHTSGLSKGLGVPYDSPMTRTAYIAHVLEKRRTHAPGDHFSYSNVGYAILAAIVEVASGTSFEEYCRTHLFQPAGLRDTGFIGDKRLLESGGAAARIGNGPSTWSAVNWHWGWGYRGMGGVVTTLRDLLAWDRALRGDRVLGAAARKTLFTPGESDYACGWRIETSPRGTQIATHGGGVMGFRCILARGLDEDFVVAVLTNDAGDPHRMRSIVEESLHPAPRVEATIDVTPASLSRYRAAEFPSGLRWRVEKGEQVYALILEDDRKRTPVRIRIPKTYAAKVVAGLESGIAARMRDDDGKAAAMEGGVYLSGYPKEWDGRSFDLKEKLGIDILPLYRGRGEDGKAVVDKRVVFVLTDGRYRMWPVMIKMNVAAARTLLQAIR